MRKLKHEEIPRLSTNTLAIATKHPVTVLVDNVRSLYNVGAIFRTSDAARIEHLVLAGITGTPNNRGLHKTALGAQDMVAWSYAKDGAVCAKGLKNKGYTIAALEITTSPMLTTDVTRSMFPLCLVVGNELVGVHDDLIALADVALEIPLYGAKQSLNVAVAYGIAIFDIVRAYRQGAGLPVRPDDIPAPTPPPRR